MTRYGRSPRAITYTDWTLERIEGGISDMRDSLRQKIQKKDSQFRDEAIYLDKLLKDVEFLPRKITGPITDSIAEGTEDIVNSINSAASYLRNELSDIKWSLTQLNDNTAKILDVILNSLDNESRQYFQQGVKSYNSNELDIAKECFEKALNADKTNSFVYQYLGFISAAQKNPELAIRNFELASKFAPDDSHKALAFSHLAHCKYSLGNYQEAAELSGRAASISQGKARFFFEHAGYCTKAGQTELGLANLKEAIKKDWLYFTIADGNKMFDPAREEVSALLEDLRAKEKSRAVKLTAYLNISKAIADKLGFVFFSQEKGLPVSDNVYDYVNTSMANIETLDDIVKDASEFAEKQALSLDRETDAYKSKQQSIIGNIHPNRINESVMIKTAVGIGLSTGVVVGIGIGSTFEGAGAKVIGGLMIGGAAGFLSTCTAGVYIGSIFGGIAEHIANRDIKKREANLEKELCEMRNKATTKKNVLLNLVEKLKENYSHAYADFSGD